MIGSRHHAGALGSRAPKLPILFVTFLSLLLSLCGPALAAGAQGDPAATPSVQETEAATEGGNGVPASLQGTEEATVEATEPIEEQTAEATEATEATAEQTAEATESPVAAGTDEPESQEPQSASLPITTEAATGTIVIRVYTCPPGVGPADTFSAYFPTCQHVVAPYDITVTNGAGFSQTVTTSPQVGGAHQSASFTGVPASDILIEQTLPAAYAEPAVRCSIPGGTGHIVQLQAIANTVPWSLQADQRFTCEFVNFPPAAGGDPGDDPEPSSLTLAVKRCSDGFDPDTDAFADCSTTEDGVPFAVSGPSGDLAGTTGDSAPGATRFGAIAPGTYDIAMTPPADAASVYVRGCVRIGVPSEIPSTSPATGGPLTLIVEPGSSYLCQWYIVPAGDDDPGETGTVRVSKYTCPEGVERSDDDYALSEVCRVEAAPVSFEISDSAGADIPLTLESGVPQHGEIADLAFGTVWIAEIIPDGYGEPLVFCSDSPADGAGNYESVAISGGNAVSWELRPDAGMPLTCLFFNFPNDDSGSTGTVHVSKYTCPDGTEPTGDSYLLSEQCREEIAPVSFTVIATAGGYERTVTADPGVPQSATFTDVPHGEIAIGESVPPGYGHPLVFCADTAADGPGAYVPVEPWPESGAFIIEHRADAEIDLSCTFFNFPEDDDPGNTVTVNKYTCPSWVNPETDILLDACAPGGDGIPFTFVDGNGMHPAAVSGGSITWTDVVIGTEGELQVIEDIPAGYGDPWVVCDGILMASAGGFVIPNPGDARPFHVECDWFNIALDDAALAVVKHTCEPGYDLRAAGADPMADCPDLTDGVDFRITGMGADMTSTTGDAGTGMVQFGGLDPGDYTLTETVPAGTASSFVLDCYGNDLGAVRPYPLAAGDTLDVTLHAGEVVTCHWFNVPEIPGAGMTVVKYLCAGESFEHEVDCEIYEDGVTFDLVVRDGDAWVNVATATTNDHGTIAWSGLEPGHYWLSEHDGEWCHIASAHLSEDSTGIAIEESDEAVVKVYNCGAEPGKPGETPTKFPDTGVPPAGEGAGGPGSLPAASLAGLLALPLSRRRLAALAVALPAAGVVGHAVAQDDEQTIEPADGTAGPPSAPASLCLPSSDGGCERGPVPAALRIGAIGVDAPVEVLETVAGEMQQPTDETHVAWYKETARLGEAGNMVFAGHLNWWGVPEAVFYNLASLGTGDEVVVEGADGRAWTFAVEWVRQLSATEPPGEDVLGATSLPAVTLITCGGEWDSATSAYDSRTVVRANLVARP
jgi:sortase (surface protein transpeptidase)